MNGYNSKGAQLLRSVTDRYRADCEKFKRLDAEYGTPRNSPLHHDNRCQIVH